MRVRITRYPINNNPLESVSLEHKCQSTGCLFHASLIFAHPVSNVHISNTPRYNNDTLVTFDSDDALELNLPQV